MNGEACGGLAGVAVIAATTVAVAVVLVVVSVSWAIRR